MRRYSKPNYARRYRNPNAKKKSSSNISLARRLYTRYVQPRSMEASGGMQFKRTYRAASLTSTTSFSSLLISFSLSSLPDVSEFTTLFDNYRVDKLVVRIIPQFTNATGGTSILDAYPGSLLTAIDFDGGTLTLTEDQFYSYDTCQITSPFATKIITIKPRAELAVIDSTAAVVAAASSSRNQWFDFSNVNIQHHGVRVGVQPNTTLATGAGQIWFIYVDAFLTCRASR